MAPAIAAAVADATGLVVTDLPLRRVRTVVHPTFAELQCEGNVAFGIGQALSESMVWGGETGALLNDSLLDYRIPSLRDLPETFSVGMTEDPAGRDSARIHGLGETGSPAVPAAIGNAVTEALGRHIHDLPLHPERLWSALDHPH